MKKLSTVLIVILAMLCISSCFAENPINPETVTAGNIVTFGHYEQDGKKGNDTEPIEWIVLDVLDGKALLLSKYGLDAKPYDKNSFATTWEKCSLRAWLNNEFISKAFTTDEQSAILLTDVDNSAMQGNTEYSTDGGNNTQDRLFLLSYHEVFDIYFQGDIEKRCIPTEYAVSKGCYVNDKHQIDDRSAGWWWLRSPGTSQNTAFDITDDGSLMGYICVDSGNTAVRPAFWLDLNAEIFK